MTQVWKRGETPTPPLHELWQFKEFPPTPCFEASDGKWFHPMPGGVPVALAHLGRDPMEIDPVGAARGGYDDRKAYFGAVRDLYLARPMDEWVGLLQSSDVPCQPIGPAEEALQHPQLIHNGAVISVEVPGVGSVRQFGRAFRMEGDPFTFTPTPPPEVGADEEELVALRASRSPTPLQPRSEGAGSGRGPLSGIRVLDFGTALAGPFGPMILGDMGADVIKIDPIGQGVGQPGESTWVACQRGKRSIAIDLKSEAGQRIAAELIATADVLHYNLRTGVAERLGFDYETAWRINPRIVFCHVTAYGSTGPLAKWPGVDQMGQAVCGHEYEQGATPNGGHPTWYRFGMCDAATGMLSVLGVLEALLLRERHGDLHGRKIEADILTAGLFLASDAFEGPAGLPRRPHLDREQMGLGALNRLYQTAEGWLCIFAEADRHWDSLCEAMDLQSLRGDERLQNASGRARHADELVAVLEPAFRLRPGREWKELLDQQGVPCEMSVLDGASQLWDDSEAGLASWVTTFQHPVWGRLDQPGNFVEFSVTPGKPEGPPPVLGADTRSILAELGYEETDIDQLREKGIVAW